MLAALGGLLLVMLISFVISCRAKKDRDSEVEEEDNRSGKTPMTPGGNGGNRRVGKAD